MIIILVILFLVDCEIDGYIEGVCSVLCGTGIKTISPNITQHPQFDGKSCPADEVVPCVGDKCPGEYIYIPHTIVYICL